MEEFPDLGAYSLFLLLLEKESLNIEKINLPYHKF